MKQFTYTTQAQVRAAFWEAHHFYKRHAGWTQNQYPTDTRVAFVDYIDYLRRNGDISDALAQRITL